MRRTRMGVAVTAGVAAAGALLLWLAHPLCACTPELDSPRPPSLGRVFRDLDGAQQRVWSASGRYSAAPIDLPPVALPAGVRVVPLSATHNTYRIRIDSGAIEGRSCIIDGGRDASGVPRPFTVDCRPFLTQRGAAAELGC